MSHSWSASPTWRAAIGMGAPGAAAVSGGGAGGGGGGAVREPRFQRQDQAPLADLVADLDPHVLDRPRARRRHLHRGLVGFECDQRVFRLDPVAALYRDLDDRHILEVADSGDSNLDYFVDTGGGAVVGNRCALTGGAAALLDLLSGCEAGGRDLRLGDKDEGALGNLVADLDPDFLDHAVDRRGYLHRCLVRFQRD